MLRIWNNLGYDAMRESSEERRQMLADAAVSLAISPLPIERKARLERTLRALDPVDVCDLHGLARIVGKKDTDGTSALTNEHLMYRLWHGGRVENPEILQSAGCVALDGFGGFGGVGPHLQVSRLGRDLLSVMGSYAKRRGATFEIPGRGPTVTVEERVRAQEVVALLPGLSEFLRWASVTPGVGKQYETPSEGETYELPNGERVQRPLLHLNIYDGLQRGAVEAMASVVAAGLLRAHLGADLRRDDFPGAFTAYIAGPHEILRVLAESDDWWWV